jgi:hypothetical protein
VGRHRRKLAADCRFGQQDLGNPVACDLVMGVSGAVGSQSIKLGLSV